MNVFHACFNRVATVISIRNSSPPSWHKKSRRPFKVCGKLNGYSVVEKTYLHKSFLPSLSVITSSGCFFTYSTMGPKVPSAKPGEQSINSLFPVKRRIAVANGMHFSSRFLRCNLHRTFNTDFCFIDISSGAHYLLTI